jgi:ribosomal protein S18 acetylase RimI-like enzyme
VDDILTDLSDACLSTAIKANLYAFFRSLRHSSQAEFSESTQLLQWHTHVPHPWFNGVLCFGHVVGGEEQTIRDTLSYFMSRSVTSFTWWFEPGAEASVWSNLLPAHHMRYDANTPGMAVAFDALPRFIPHPDTLSIQQVADRDMLRTWAATFVRGYELPDGMATPFFGLMASLPIDLPFRYYLGYVRGRPVATSMLFLGAGVAGIYDVATLPEARGQGVGASLTLQPLLDAHAMGYRAGVLQSSRMGLSVYKRLGFRQCCTLDHYYWTAD